MKEFKWNFIKSSILNFVFGRLLIELLDTDFEWKWCYQQVILIMKCCGIDIIMNITILFCHLVFHKSKHRKNWKYWSHQFVAMKLNDFWVNSSWLMN